MKFIFDSTLGSDNVYSVAASNSDPSYPASNMRDDFPTNLWRSPSGYTSACVWAYCTTGCALELLNTNATSITMTIGTGGTYQIGTATGYSMSMENGYIFETTNTTITSSVSNLPGTNGRFWADFPQQNQSFIIRIELTASSAVYAGILRAGNIFQINDPAPGHSESSKDYSIEMELNNGANYYVKRNVVRTFSNLNVIDSRSDAWTIKINCFDALGPKPVAIKMFDSANITDDEFVIFAKRVNPIQLTHISKNWTGITFDLKEVV
jgi:hypothetical protein